MGAAERYIGPGQHLGQGLTQFLRVTGHRNVYVIRGNGEEAIPQIASYQEGGALARIEESAQLCQEVLGII